MSRILSTGGRCTPPWSDTTPPRPDTPPPWSETPGKTPHPQADTTPSGRHHTPRQTPHPQADTTPPGQTPPSQTPCSRRLLQRTVCILLQWRIQDFPQGGAPTPKSAIIFQFFPRKLHENERIWTPGGGTRPWHPPLDPPMYWNAFFLLVAVAR